MDTGQISATALLPVPDGRGFEERRQQILDACKQYLATRHAEIRPKHDAGAGGTEVVHLLAAAMDRMVCALFRNILTDLEAKTHQLDAHLALVAVGGYGRGELNPFSDIDIMFLHDGTVAVETVEAFAQKLLYILWDLRLDVGYSVRTTADCSEMALQDLTVKTALIDCRYLVGHQPLYDTLRKTVYTQILPKAKIGRARLNSSHSQQSRMRNDQRGHALQR